MKKFFNKIIIFTLMLTVLVVFSACGRVSAGTDVNFKVDNSIMQIPGATASVSQTTAKRSFVGENIYADRFYSSFGELDSIEISVSGSILRAGLTDTSKDFFRLMVLAPYATESILVWNDKITQYSKADLKNGYFAIDIQWLNGFAHYGTVQNGKDINCFYLLFTSQTGQTLGEYFVYITYNLIF